MHSIVYRVFSYMVPLHRYLLCGPLNFMREHISNWLSHLRWKLEIGLTCTLYFYPFHLWFSAPHYTNFQNNFLWVCWFLDKNISNFVPPSWNLDNPHYHTIYLSNKCKKNHQYQILAVMLKISFIFPIKLQCEKYCNLKL